MLSKIASFDGKLIDLIQKGDLNSIMDLGMLKADLEKSFILNLNVQIINNSAKKTFKTINAPLPIVLTILCEQIDILSYFIFELHVSLFEKRTNGWTPLHYSCCTFNPSCFVRLLSIDYVQKEIDCPVDIVSDNPSYKTTALHIAVTNKYYSQALVLTRSFPDILYTYDEANKKYIKLDEPIKSTYPHSNVNQISATGNTPLHIAVYLKDIDLISILIHGGADPYVPNSNGVHALDFAKMMSHDIYILLKNKNIVPLDVLLEKYLPQELRIKDNNHEETEKVEAEVNDEESYDDDEVDPTILDLEYKQESLQDMIQQLYLRIETLERNKNKEHLNICSSCSVLTDNRCPKCKTLVCDACISGEMHKCPVKM